MIAGTLTNLATVKEWLSVTDDDSNLQLMMLIRGASEFALNYMNRNNWGRAEYLNQLLDGFGNPFIVLKEYPVIDVISLSVGQMTFNPASGSPPSNGYWLDNSIQNAPQKLSLLGTGYVFPRARSSVMISYTAGYFIKDELHTVPAVAVPPPDPVVPLRVSTWQRWYSNFSVFQVTPGGPVEMTYTQSQDPADGEYSVDTMTGEYLFNVAQAEEDVLISYSYVPADIWEAVTEIVGERFKAKDRIGYNSKSLGGQETVSFNNQAMSNFTREALNRYRRVF